MSIFDKIILVRSYALNTLISSLSLLTLGAVISIPAQAAIHYDSHGNVGYDTLAECQTAIQSGTARFYKPVTSDKPILRGSEVSVGTARLGNLAPEYSRGTCDIGTSGRNGRDGVARAIQGKYVPYSPDMVINQYSDVSGNITRVTMGQCDNWFSGPLPQGMPVVTDPVLVPVPAPIAQPVVLVPTPLAAVSAAAGSIPVWVPVLAGVAAVILLASGGDSDSSSTTGTTGTN
ncbi:hypothetical protein AOC03_06170 [Psychrobacter urativorans]|uniref:Uncharacterized protein n=1 Tax=Psychrobacter urativorans TaxID=45610 RepID=A0A0M5MJJ2_9GAMM|nr:hypothetical protein AOC03_06170 [Psychrobacter urativorans]